MRRLFILLGLFMLCLQLKANLDIRIEGDTFILPETDISGIPYVGINDMHPIFHSICKQDRIDHRLYLHTYGETFIFMEGSSYYNFKLDSYNMHFPIQRIKDQYYVPSIFVRENLPLHFPKDMVFKSGQLQLSKPVNRNVKTIVLDPGHGGKDPGAVGRKLKAQEKEVNLGVTLKLKRMLEQELGLNVLMTRSDDRFVSLGDRTKFANDRRGDLFVSIHTNASRDPKSKGSETYYLATAMTSDARAVEALENQVVDLYEGGADARSKYDDLDFILSDLSQTEHLESSNELASNIQQNLVAGSGFYDRGVKQANFYVLRGAFMPSVLVELGFISNPEEEKLLVNDEYQERLARTIFEGIKRFKYRYDRIRNT
ncbi:MAG: N-acetylmuramoyl-L-alanine amidase [Candidatus Cloacimonetes bacterium]|jgi:N-acetylmuramoyl-L-alanine amidase|nr:N-acetylmuramoyl-L-alanine amidase [Candidatus Cloacimonadota bacterium]MDD2544252.1 N-acetylmuramoyl-L-alanine amidase [Candidatus Cloacimonadota bacterium]MDD2683165.1 N-acetylmuramoyl-L-alanine amidase [Candidatus Cloacimonadota bacterium]MDD3577737.1 N-acetylmuramoyl-L-alanine amidase [Candidatus Cloacimonadota bacterium]MDY0337708.1 N-acetylmuramoyl-L-alanine amidase [Candidatus Cloacimonadaceae bacterium]